MSDVEEFGLDEPPIGVDFEPGDDPALLALTDAELGKRIAATMDPEIAAGLRQEREIVRQKLIMFQGDGITKEQWLSLSEAWAHVQGNNSWFPEQITALGGITGEAYQKLSEMLKEHHRQPKGKGKGKGKKDKPVQQDCGPGNTPEERWPHVVEHGKNVGVDAQLVFDELGLRELTHEAVSATLREINARFEGTKEVEEFGLGEQESTFASEIPVNSASVKDAEVATVTGATEDSLSESAPAVPGFNPRPILWDEQLKKAIETDTGEVVTVSYFLEIVGLAEIPTEPNRETCEKILDAMHTKYLDPAKRYRENAEKLAKPLEDRARQMEEFWGPYLDNCGRSFLKKAGARSKTPGVLTEKTLQFLGGAIQWIKDGGTHQSNPGEFYAWVAKKKEELLALREQKTAEAAEEIALLEKKYGLRLVTEAKADNEKIKALKTGELPPGWESKEANEFAERRIK